MKKGLKIFSLAILLTAALLTPVYAIGDNEFRTTVENNIAVRCNSITNRIELIITKYDVNHQRHVQRYQNISTNISELITKLNAQGYDTKALQEDLDQLDAYINEFSEEYASFVQSLKLSQSYACANSEGDFRRAVEEARGYLLKARETSLDIRILINDEIRGDLNALKNE